MAYIGKAPVNGFHSKQQLTGDGSTVTFTLDYTVADETSLIVSVGGVLQEPKTAFDLVQGGTKITFTEAPASTDRAYIQFLGLAVVQNLLDINGAQFVLDVDGDTTITADTDDEIDIRVGGTDRSTIKATGYHNVDSVKFVAGTGDDMQMYHDGTNSYLTNSTGALKIATESSGIALTIGHTTSEVTFGDNVTITGTLTVGGAVSFGDFDITNVGSIALDTITNDGTDITLDSSGDIILDAGGDTIFLKDSGTTFGSLDNSSSNLIIKSGTTTAATFSGANVTLAGTVGSGAITSTGTVQGTTITATTNFVPDASDGAGLGTASLEFSDLFLADASTIQFGADQDVTLTHVADTGLLLNSTMAIQFNDASQYINAPSNAILDINATDEIELNATLVDVNANLDVSGTIVGASTLSATTGTFSGILKTDDATEATSTTDGSLQTDGGLSVVKDAVFGDDVKLLSDAAVLGFGADGDVTLTHVADTGVLLNSTMAIQFNDASQYINAPSNAILDINATDEIELNATLVDINANADISGTLTLAGNLIVGSATVTEAQLEILDGATVTTTELNLIDGGTSRGTTAVASGDGILINDAGTMAMTNVDTVSTYFASHSVGGGNIVTTGALDTGSITSGFGAIDNGTSNIRSATITAETAFVPDASGGADLGTTALEFNDAFFNDSAVINFGDDQDTTLTHTDGTGLTLNSTNKLCFNDASQFIQGGSATVLEIGATDEIGLTATAIDIDGTCDVSGTLTNATVAVNVAGKQTIWIPSNAMTPTASNGCAAIAAVETTSGRPDMYVLDFDKDSDEFAQFSVAFPKQWNLGTVTYQVFWSGIAATTEVDWMVDAVGMPDNSTIDVAYGTAIVVTDAAQGAVEELLVSAESGAVTIAGTPADDDLTYFRIGRDVSGDDMAGDARLHGVKIFYTTDAKNDA